MDLLHSTQAAGWMLNSKKGIAVLHEEIVKCWTGPGKLQLRTVMAVGKHPYLPTDRFNRIVSDYLFFL